MSSFFFLQAEKNSINSFFIDKIAAWAEANKTQTYILDRPLGDDKYAYSHKEAFVLLIPKHKLVFIDFSKNAEGFKDYIEDFTEDLGYLSDKYLYKEKIGRPRQWKDSLISTIANVTEIDIDQFISSIEIVNAKGQRSVELLISLLTGSINDIQKVGIEVPETILDKVKRKIILFDGEQTRFIYQKPSSKVVRIQGLSGTGKTELLLHKLKDIFVQQPEYSIAVTCHNKILANSLRQRIPDFFNFMRVERQIKWDENLFCAHAWGSQAYIYSGIYSYICHVCGIPFQRYSQTTTFDDVCTDALNFLQNAKYDDYLFDYTLIDESQDFPPSFIELCERVTKHHVYVAGDIFQSIFDENIVSDISPDFLLSKCYRTDPKTLMFAHALGMGLFEDQKLRWLEDKEWEACGYIVEKCDKNQNGSRHVYNLKREPLRRFEDISRDHYDSAVIDVIEGDFYSSVPDEIIYTINQIKSDNPTATADDIGIVFLDKNKLIYNCADKLSILIPETIGFNVNKAHETKKKISGELFISNRNNVKGLEFPFVICVTRDINSSHAYRNALYMTLTRSFLRSYLIISSDNSQSLIDVVSNGLEIINRTGAIKATEPTPAEKELIKTTIRQQKNRLSFYDSAQALFDKMKIEARERDRLRRILIDVLEDEFDETVAVGIITAMKNAFRR